MACPNCDCGDCYDWGYHLPSGKAPLWQELRRVARERDAYIIEARKLRESRAELMTRMDALRVAYDELHNRLTGDDKPLIKRREVQEECRHNTVIEGWCTTPGCGKKVF